MDDLFESTFDRCREWVLGSRYGLASVTALSGIAGLTVVLVELWLTGIFTRLGDATLKIVLITGAYAVFATAIGSVAARAMQRRTLSWFWEQRAPTEQEGRAVIRLPLDVTYVDGALWIPGIVLEAALFSIFLPGRDLAIGAALVTLGGLSAAGFTYLVVDRILRPAIPFVSRVIRPVSHPSSTVLVRVLITWALASGLPLASVALVLCDTSSAANERIRTALWIAMFGIASGYVATAFLARSVALPMGKLRDALQAIERGELDVYVPVRTTSEIGLLETSVNDMVHSLRERNRLREVFGRHVGANVADRALEAGVDLTGDMREVSALFVDVVGSTALAHQLEPREFVDKLNRLLSSVVDATTANGGLVNKFEGDAALCIFGAPIELDDDASAALRAARRIRDEVAATGELDIGVGVARGLVFAGDVGSATRLEYTVIGDAVNEAARLTEAAKNVPQRILVSQQVVEASTSHERDLWTSHGVLKLRGREDETKSWTDNRGRPHRASRPASSSTVETGVSQTNPRQTYATDLP
ncbi:adenylate/guanylate cyclase domain-containing protein [Antrihabitans sp. YC2-6]|uniref:adenylate/guanylate cyclase domain-containing protein n=1 Tax=Antrihabitans sp. YC2-6 TaxID=2799498 RepID=UPI0018F70A8B|nr:adenylate/guanylate cyclase domain-containing protein [Antrihabitans sp. YC2-6]MBJ8343768.1 adenylate/guanylate cyclase domain-containing protein [Antrihabitans sp. YC2-6]